MDDDKFLEICGMNFTQGEKDIIKKTSSETGVSVPDLVRILKPTPLTTEQLIDISKSFQKV